MRFRRISLSLAGITLLIGCDRGESSKHAGMGGTTAGGGPGSGGAEANGGTAGAGASAAGSASGAPANPITAKITIGGTALATVAPTFFGQNYWSWVPAWGDPVAAVETQADELKLGLLRAGGANNDRQEPVAFTLAEVDEFVAFSHTVGAEPLLQVPLIKNLAGEPATAQDAADLVTYVNVTKSYGIQYFSIGNEPDLYQEQSLMPAGYDPAAFCATFREFATAMRAVDSSIKIVGPDLSWKYQSGPNDWLTPFLQECGDVTDIVAVHRYPFAPGATTDTAAYADASAYRSLLDRLKGILKATGQDDKPLAVTEANITWDGDPANPALPASPGTFPAALWLADNLGVSLEAGLFNVAYWSLSEGWTLGFFDGATPRPVFHVLKLFSTRFGTEVLTVAGAPTGVSVYAGRDSAAAASSVFVVNKTESALELEVEFADHPRLDSATLSVAPHSLYFASVPDDGKAPKITGYTADMSEPTLLTP